MTFFISLAILNCRWGTIQESGLSTPALLYQFISNESDVKCADIDHEKQGKGTTRAAVTLVKQDNEK
jgi:hypothetical protein